jgi:hypothetical protein
MYRSNRHALAPSSHPLSSLTISAHPQRLIQIIDKKQNETNHANRVESSRGLFDHGVGLRKRFLEI